MTRLLSVLAACAFCAASLYAQQSNPAFSVTAGVDPLTNRTCNDIANVGSIYTTMVNPSVTSVCQQTGATTFGWVSSFIATVSGGTLTIAGGKAPVINNTLTFAGTDATTMTFPSASGTVATLGATQNFKTLTGFADSTTASKTLIISLSGATASTATTLTFAQTAARTVTFPDASITVARSDAAQTFTGVQTFSSAPVLSTGTITNTGTITMPTTTGGVAELFGCGASTGNATCANTSGGATARVITGLATLASNAAVISGISPAFTSTSTFSCVGNDTTTRANPIQVVNTSSTSITLTDTTGASDVISYVCIGY